MPPFLFTGGSLSGPICVDRGQLLGLQPSLCGRRNLERGLGGSSGFSVVARSMCNSVWTAKHSSFRFGLPHTITTAAIVATQMQLQFQWHERHQQQQLQQQQQHCLTEVTVTTLMGGAGGAMACVVMSFIDHGGLVMSPPDLSNAILGGRQLHCQRAASPGRQPESQSM